jgi:hypothetical protein
MNVAARPTLATLVDRLFDDKAQVERIGTVVVARCAVRDIGVCAPRWRNETLATGRRIQHPEGTQMKNVIPRKTCVGNRSFPRAGQFLGTTKRQPRCLKLWTMTCLGLLAGAFLRPPLELCVPARGFCRGRPKGRGNDHARHSSDHYSDPVADRRATHVAVQYRVGILSRGRTWPYSDHRHHSRLGRSDLTKRSFAVGPWHTSSSLHYRRRRLRRHGKMLSVSRRTGQRVRRAACCDCRPTRAAFFGFSLRANVRRKNLPGCAWFLMTYLWFQACVLKLGQSDSQTIRLRRLAHRGRRSVLVTIGDRNIPATVCLSSVGR